MTRRYIRPVDPERLIARPGGGHVAPGGEYVDWGPYWTRRVRDRDVEESAPTAARAPEPPAPDEPDPPEADADWSDES